MTTPITTPPEWLVKLVISAAKSIPGIAQGVVTQLERNMIPLDFAVFGYRGTGKTTFLNYMRYGVPTEVSPTPYGYEELDPFQIYVVGRSPVKVAGVYDVSGESDEEWKYGTSGESLTWSLWEEIFIGQTPRGIIFMIDHESIEKNKAALRYVIDMINRSDPPVSRWARIFGRRKRTKARQNLKVFMLLVNKLDIWEKQGLTMEKILSDYAAEINDLIAIIKRNNGKLQRDAISALYGTNCERALQGFVLGLLAIS